jgi:hypothetical protein
VCPHYEEIDSEQVKKLLEDRIEFKIWAAQRHLDKLVKIEKFYGGVMGKNRIYAEDELDCYFAQLIGAGDSLLNLINLKLKLDIPEDRVTLTKIYTELEKRSMQDIITDLNSLNCDEGSWYRTLRKLRNRSIHISILRKQVKVNVGAGPSTVKNYLLSPPSYKTPMEEETILFLSESLENMKNLIDKTREKIDRIDCK